MNFYSLMQRLIIGLAIITSIFSSRAFPADEWLKDEVLKQISELRQDNKALHGEVDSLQKQVAELRGQGGAAGNVKNLADLLGGNTPLGQKTAKLIMVEFTDYECPFCKKFAVGTFPELKKQYIDTGKLQYTVRDFPLAFHGQAAAAAAAVRCAGEQGAYWAMKPGIFQHQDKLGKELFLQQAAELKLDVGKFGRCLDDARIRKAVEADVAYGNSIGIQATPSFLVGRIDGKAVKDIKAVSGAISFANLSQLLDTLEDAVTH